MQLTNEQIKAVSEWMVEHGIDQGLVGKFERDWVKDVPQDDTELYDYLVEEESTPATVSELLVSEFFRKGERKAWAEYTRTMEDFIMYGQSNKPKTQI